MYVLKLGSTGHHPKSVLSTEETDHWHITELIADPDPEMSLREWSL